MRSFNESFKRDVPYDNIRSHKKLELHSFSKKLIFGKTTGQAN